MRLVLFALVSWSAVVWAQPAPAEPPSETLARALELHERGDHGPASIELHEVVSGQTVDTPANVQRAQLVLAVTLHRMEYHAASMGVISQIVEAGPAHAAHTEAVRWILALAAVPGSFAAGYLRPYQGELDAVAAALDEPARDELRYQLGAELARAGELDDARRLLARVAPGSRAHARARLTLARLELRRGGLPAGAAAAIAAAGDPGLAAEAARAIAESSYAARDPAGARDALGRLAAVSPIAAFARSRIELAQAGAMPAVSGAPVAALEAVVIATACARGWTDDVRPHAAATVRNTREAIDELIAASDDDNAQMYEVIERFLAESSARTVERPSELAIRIALARIGDPALWAAELGRELRRVAAADRAWQTTPIAAQVLQELTIHQSIAQADLGKLQRERLASMRRHLGEVGRAIDGATAAVAAGPDAAAERGLVVSDATCAAALGRTPPASQIAGPGAGAAPHGRGCAGCASHGDPALVLALAWLLIATGGPRARPPAARARPRDPTGAR